MNSNANLLEKLALMNLNSHLVVTAAVMLLSVASHLTYSIKERNMASVALFLVAWKAIPR